MKMLPDNVYSVKDAAGKELAVGDRIVYVTGGPGAGLLFGYVKGFMPEQKDTGNYYFPVYRKIAIMKDGGKRISYISSSKRMMCIDGCIKTPEELL